MVNIKPREVKVPLVSAGAGATSSTGPRFPPLVRKSPTEAAENQ